jgi:hypothetical protein
MYVSYRIIIFITIIIIIIIMVITCTEVSTALLPVVVHPITNCRYILYTAAQAADRLVPRTRAEQWCVKVASTGGLGLPAAQALPHYETSAKTAINVEEAFLEAATLALLYEERKRRNAPQLFFPPTETIDLKARQGSSKQNGGCC